MDWNKHLTFKNKSGGRITWGAFAIEHNDEMHINPKTYSENSIKELKLYHQYDQIEVWNSKPQAQAEKEELPVQQVSSIDHEHTMFDGNHEMFQKSNLIDVTEINTEGRMIETDEDISLDEGGAIEVQSDQIGRIEAREFLSQHWKTLEVEVARIQSVRKLRLYLSVAQELKLGGKKLEILENRIKTITG